MKKVVAFVILVLVVGSLFAQNIERQIVGTWIDNNNDTWVFNADGTFTGANGSGRYTGTVLAFTTEGRWRGPWNIHMSTDGRTIILVFGTGVNSIVLRKS